MFAVYHMIAYGLNIYDMQLAIYARIGSLLLGPPESATEERDT